MENNIQNYEIKQLLGVMKSFGDFGEQPSKINKNSIIVGAILIFVLIGGSLAAFLAVSSLSENRIQETKKTVRFATFNLSFDRENEGQLAKELNSSHNNLSRQVKNIAQIIRINKPDIILLNEFNYDAEKKAVKGFISILNDTSIVLNDSKNTTAKPINYPYFYTNEVNTGVQPNPPIDIDGNGEIGIKGSRAYGNDCFGYGEFPGKYGMVVLSKFPIIESKVRTFRKFLWKDMPNALLPDNINTPNKKQDFYSDEVLKIFRLSSKSHWDIPIQINNKIVHVLASHPTPPTFDGPEDKNGRRNHDEIRFWVDYINPNLKNQYMYDDNNVKGGIEKNARFVIMGDQNADPVNGDSSFGAALQYLNSPNINTTITPTRKSEWINENNRGTAGDSITDTAFFAGGLRVDYVLPSNNLEIIQGRVFWPPADATGKYKGLIAASASNSKDVSSDHRLVYIDVKV